MSSAKYISPALLMERGLPAGGGNLTGFI
jgi:hypothetical protein